MKSIELKTATEKASVQGAEREIDLSTVSLLKTAINNVPEGGYTASDMLNRIKILDKIEALPRVEVSTLGDSTSVTREFLDLEDAEFALVKGYVGSVKWGVLSRFIIDFTQVFA